MFELRRLGAASFGVLPILKFDQEFSRRGEGLSFGGDRFQIIVLITKRHEDEGTPFLHHDLSKEGTFKAILEFRGVCPFYIA